MSKRRKPKYTIGDKVVIIAYGTIGEITDIKWIDGKYIYEINTNEGLFIEERLQLLSEYEGEAIDKEHIAIEYEFLFGDIVQVAGYGTELFRVIGFRTEIWRYQEDSWEDVIYELSRITDGEWLEAGQEEMTLVADAEHADAFLQNLGHLYMMDKDKQTLKLPEPKRKVENPKTNKVELEQKQKIIDQLLDVYNDYDRLYEMFQDQEYKNIKQGVLRKLKRLLNNDDRSTV
jgi:hypothetical protein